MCRARTTNYIRRPKSQNWTNLLGNKSSQEPGFSRLLVNLFCQPPFRVPGPVFNYGSVTELGYRSKWQLPDRPTDCQPRELAGCLSGVWQGSGRGAVSSAVMGIRMSLQHLGLYSGCPLSRSFISKMSHRQYRGPAITRRRRSWPRLRGFTQGVHRPIGKSIVTA